ncbi:MAG: electron transfer flavoprotein subunit beta/FixA family protein [Desulfobacterales bacterium]|nr:electron transfer flavoprotein subunit beta/FixA family protein [Desulfobacterales bacterium]MDX2510499.1 electron transfer flavoprotein subunit beta/FixA family protein [Desulfobacterales bacterium]
MKIFVCVKHVPDTAANIKVVGENGFDETVKFVMNPYDEYAVEEAVRIVQEQGGEVVAVSVGKPNAINTVRSALAVGANRGILVKTDTQFLDSTTTALALKAAIEQDGAPELIFTGKQSVDSEGMQTHYRLAAKMGLPVATDVVAFSMENNKAVVECEMGGGDREVIEMAMPCVVGATKGLNEPRYPKLPDILKAKKKPLVEMDLADLGVAASPVSAAMTSLTQVKERGAATMMKGSVQEMVEDLVNRLENDVKVL